MQKFLVSILACILLAVPSIGRAQVPAPPLPAPKPAPIPAPLPAPAPKPSPVVPPAPPAPCPCDNCKDCSIEAPETLAVWVGRPAILAIKCEKAVTFIPPDEDGEVTVTPSFVVNSFTVTAFAEGTYTLIAVVACKGEVKHAKVKIVATPKKPKPDPKPDDKPDPAPKPVPKPSDPLSKDLQSAYTLDQTIDKAEQVQSLSALYASSIDKVDAATSGASFLASLKAVAAAMKIPDGALPLVRSRIGVELKKCITAGPLTAEQKTALKTLFGQLAKGLAACK